MIDIISTMTIRWKLVTFSLLLTSLVARPTMAAPPHQPYEDCPAAGTVSRLDQSRGTIRPEDAPSPSPSAGIACSEQTSNARGRYTSTLAPCIFTFHQVIGDQDDSLIDFQTSHLCTEDNGFLVMKEYVFDFGDECVGDFQRCYSLGHHRHVLFDFLCAMEWDVPEGTTHISVNCTEDKELVTESETYSQAAAEHERSQEKRDKVELKLFNLALVMGSCLAGFFVISQWIVKPMVAHSTLRLDQGSTDQPSSCECTQTCHCGRWISSQRSSLEMESSEDFNDDRSDETNSNISGASQHDFDIQIPADFDAVPMAHATVLPGVY